MGPPKGDNGRSVTLEQLAKLGKVSVSTVSRALNDNPSISGTQKKRLWALARKHGYEFRGHMPASPIGAQGAITVVTPRVLGRPLPLSHPFFLELLASRPDFARMALIEAPAAGGRSLEMYASAKRVLQAVLDLGRNDPIE